MAQFELNVKVNGIEQTVSTIGQLEQALTATNQQLTQVEANSKEFNFLTNQASNLQTVLGALSTDAQTFNNNLSEVNTTANNLNNIITETANVATDLGNNRGTQKLSQNIEETVSSSTSLRAELRKIVQELQNLEPGSARFQELSVRAGELRDQIGDTQAVVTALAGSTAERLGRALTSTVQIGIAGFQGITAAASLFGVEAEALEPTLVKLTALLNLSQAVETFGQLPDKINEITAGFQSLTGATETATAAANANAAAATAEATSTVAVETATTGAAVANANNAIANEADAAASLQDAVAKGVEAAATDTATVATTAFGVAMKALPIVAIAAALATLAYGIYQYVTASGQAKKEEEARKKAAEDLAQAQETERKSIADASGEYALLITRLKQTTAGSKEREKLIKQINTEYGTTLQNLKNENDFQNQLNLSVIDYIALQTVRYKLDKNQEKFNKLLGEQEGLQSKLFSAETAYRAAQDKLNKSTQTAYYLELENRDRLLEAYNDAKAAVDSNKSSIDALGFSSTQLLAEREKLTKIFKGPETKKNTHDIKDNTNAVKDATAAEQFLIEIMRQRAKISTDQLITQSKATETLIDDIQAEQKIEIDGLKERLAEAIKKDKEEVDSKKKKTSELTQIEKAYDDFLLEVNANYEARIKKQTELEVTERKKANDELIREYDILQKEIKFGDQNTLDTLESLNQRRLQLAIDQIDMELKNNNLSIDEYETLQKGKAELVAAYNQGQANIDLEIAKANKIKDLQNYKEILEGRLKTTFTYNEAQLDAFVQLQDEEIAAYGQRLVDEGILQKKRDGETEADYKARLAIEAQAFKNLQKTKTNLDKEYAITAEEINQKTNDVIVTSDTDTAEKIFDVKVKLLQDYLDIASEALSQFSNDSLLGFTTLISGSINAISELVSIQEQEFETSGERIAAYAQVVGSLLNSVISSFITQNEAALEQDLQNFEINTNAKKDALTNQLNQGLISRKQYDDGVKKLDDALNKQQLDAKKKAFEQDKNLRIAQATIAGLQGAVAAFAGAMQLGPIAGPIVGGILAAAVATLTAVQISQIKKQKFDSGGTTVAAIDTPSTQTASQQINQSSSGGFTSFVPAATGSTEGGQMSGAGGGATFQKVYVLESDITAAQERVRVLEDNSTFG
jgi:hypothetical protein